MEPPLNPETKQQIRHLFNESITKWNQPHSDKFQKITKQVDNVKSLMLSNIDKVMERGESLEFLGEKSTLLNENMSANFSNKTTKIKKEFLCRYINVIIALICFLSIILFFIAAVIFFIVWYNCGLRFDQC